jgi:hypothetical protein
MVASQFGPRSRSFITRALGLRALDGDVSTVADPIHMTGDHTTQFHLPFRRPTRNTAIDRRARRKKPNLDMLEGRQPLSGGTHDVLDLGDVGDNSVKQFDADRGHTSGPRSRPPDGVWSSPW